MGHPNQNRDAARNKGLALARDLRIMTHLEMFSDLRIGVDPARIGDEKHPSVEVITGLIFRPTDREEVVIPVSKKAEGMKGVSKGSKGDLIVKFKIDAVSCWSRQNENGETVPLNDDGGVEIIPADVLHTYGDDGKPKIPTNRPVNGVVAWQYNQYGDKVIGRFLPYDIARATAEGWWMPGDIQSQYTLFPCLSYPKSKHGKPQQRDPSKARVEAKAIHPSGKVMVAFHPVLDYKKQEPYAFVERCGMIGLIPLPQVGKIDVEAAAEAAEIEIQGEAVEPGPDEFVCGNKARNIWEQLKEFSVTSESPLKVLEAVRKRILTQKHPDMLQGRLVKAKMPEALVKQLVAAASVQLPLFTGAIERAIELAKARDALEAAKKAPPVAPATEGNGESAPPTV